MIVVEDGFYDNPEEVYQTAISVKYDVDATGDGHAGARSYDSYYEDIALENTEVSNQVFDLIKNEKNIDNMMLTLKGEYEES